MSKAKTKTNTSRPLRPYERVTFIDGMSTALRSLFGDWQAVIIATNELYHQRHAEGATNKRLDAITNGSRLSQDKLEDKIFRYPLRTMQDALAIGRFAETLNKGGDVETATRSLRRVNNFIERSLRVPAAPGPLASLYDTWMDTRKRADAAGHAGKDDEACALDAARDKVVDMIAAARATSPADAIVKLRVLRWGVYLLAEGDADRQAELRMIDGLIADAETAQKTEGHDDALIALCAKWQAGNAEEVTVFKALGDLTGAAYDKAHAAADAIQTRNNAMLYRISTKQPRTVQGFIAQLRTVGQFHREMEGDGSGPTGGPSSAQAMLHRVMGQAERFAVPAIAAEPAPAPAIAAE